MVTADLVVRGARVVTPQGTRPAAVHVRDGTITGVTHPSAVGEPRDLVEAGDLVVLPGLVDTHVHVNEPGRSEWEGFTSATRAAAAGGVTTLVDMPLNSVPPTTSVAGLEVKRAAAEGRCHVDVGFWGGAVPGNLGELGALHDAGVFGFKSFLVPSGVDEFGFVDPATLHAVLAELAAIDALAVVHAEAPGPIAAAAAVLGEPGDPARRRHATWEASRPEAAEREAVELLVAACRTSGARVHVLHLSAAAALAPLRAARAEGLPLSAETCPHYLTLVGDDVPDGATAAKCAPPVRGEANREALWEALAEGVIDLVVSDHSPSPAALKHLDSGDFAAAWGGIASLQLGLSLVWTAARARGHGLEDVVRWMAQRPAALAGLACKGAIAPGRDADLVLFAPRARWTVDPAALEHRHPVSPYTGRELTGRVLATYLRGRCVFALRGTPAATTADASAFGAADATAPGAAVVGSPVGALLRRGLARAA